MSLIPSSRRPVICRNHASILSAYTLAGCCGPPLRLTLIAPSRSMGSAAIKLPRMTLIVPRSMDTHAASKLSLPRVSDNTALASVNAPSAAIKLPRALYAMPRSPSAVPNCLAMPRTISATMFASMPLGLTGTALKFNDIKVEFTAVGAAVNGRIISTARAALSTAISRSRRRHTVDSRRSNSANKRLFSCFKSLSIFLASDVNANTRSSSRRVPLSFSATSASACAYSIDPLPNDFSTSGSRARLSSVAFVQSPR